MGLRLAVTLAISFLLVPFVAEAQQANTITRIGFLTSSSVERERPHLAAFQHGLRELGYLEDKNLFIEQRYAGGQLNKLPEMAAELVGLKVDVIVVAGTAAALAAKKTTNVIPIVMTNGSDPVRTGVVASLAQPGGNVTGLSDFNADLVAKQFQLLKEVVPSASRIGALWNPTNPSNPNQLKTAQVAAATLGVTLLSFEVRGSDEIDRAFAAIKTKHAEALIVIGDAMLGSHGKRILAHSTKSRLPVVYWSREFPNAGGLMSYGADLQDLSHRAAAYVDKILKGAKPADLPVEQPTKFELVINLKTAKALGLTIPPSILVRADQIIQ